MHQVGAEYAEAYEAAMFHVENIGALFCHAYDQPDIAVWIDKAQLLTGHDHFCGVAAPILS